MHRAEAVCASKIEYDISNPCADVLAQGYIRVIVYA